ncbi:uncharacterized protein LOC129241562 [Anastrepha obliqua]|uniref:uncharacterized protein LOC129241562 n=1 Tax=Anastrepha obliqua TaxID=95512 RepID=UPI00240942E9|nr:uncharacterized protein LOC129241562 [Anastrepha obliqua]
MRAVHDFALHCTTIHRTHEHINAIATLFSSYKITKPSLVKSAPAHNSSSSTTLENSNTAEKPTHNSRKKSAMLEPRKCAPMSSHSVSSSRNHSISPTSLRENSPIITDAEVAADPKLNMKCAVVLRENEEVLKYKKQEIAFINDLLEKQREMQRQRALKRQELQNILKKKCDEGKRLMAEITEIKRQRAEAQEKSLLAQQKQQQSTNISNRKRVLVRDRKIKLKAKTTTTTRSATPTRTVAGQGDAKTTENEIDKSVAEAVQAAKGDSLEVAANAKSLIDVAAAITDISGEKLVTTTQMPPEIGNDLAEVIPQSPKKRAQSPSNVSEIESPTASSSIKTQDMDIESKALQSTGDFAAINVEEVPKANPVPMKKSANKTSLSEKPKLPIVKGKLTPATHARCVRSMTPVRSVVEAPATKTTVSSTQTPSDIEPTRQNALLKSSLSFSSLKSSRTHLLRAPSLSPSIFMPRNRVDVRQSMRDHSSNTDFTSSTKSWFLHASARTFTKTLKVRLKRLQHLNLRSSPSYSAEKNDNNKSARPASTIPVFSNKSVTNVVPLEDAIKRIEEPKLSILELSPSKTERVQKLKQRLKSQLLEMDEKYGATVTKVIENVLINASREETPNPPTSTAEIRAKKAVRRKAQRKQTQHSKKLKLSGKATSEHKESKRQLDITSSKSDDKKANEDAGKTENGAQCDSDRIELDNTTANKMAENESKNTDISAKPCIALNENTEEEDTNCRQENCAKEQEAPEEPAKQDRHELVDEVAISICKETSADVAMDIGDDTNTVDQKLRSKLIHDGTTTVDEKLRNKLAHGAIVTQVVDVTPGRHVKDNLLGEILIVQATSKSAVSNNIEVPKIESKTSNAQTVDADIASSAEKSVEELEERCSTPPSLDLSCIKPSSTLPEDAIKQAPTGISNEMAAADTSLAMPANTTAKPQTTPNLKSKELQNKKKESLIATGVILSKISSCDSISSNLEIVPDPPTSIGLQNDSHTRSIMPIGDNTSENAKPTVAENHENRNEFVRLEVSTSSLCGDEESSSDCLLSHLSKQVRKISDLDSIVDASTVHVIKDATMTLMSFEATPTLPTYLLNGESRDVPTPPAISTPVPTPLPILTTEVISDTEQQRHTATPTSALLESAKSELTLTPAQEPKENKPDRLQKSDFQTSTTTSLENEPEQVPEKNIPTVALPMLVEQELEKLTGKPLLENTINSTAPGSAISTSDHEVSSTQELVYIPSTKRSNSNTLNNSLDMATPTLVEEATMVVQNSQIDTTHHLPENSYYMRRRARKFSDEFTLRENKGDNTVTKVALKQRRKTFSSESSLHVQFAPNTLFTTNENTLISSRATTSASTSSGLKSGGGGSGGSSPSTTTEPVTKHTHQTRRRNHIQKSRNKTQSPSTGRSRGGGGVSELNSTFVFGCSRLQTSKSDMADSERCVVLPASAVVPPVNLGNISRAYTKKTLSQIKVFVPPEGEMCLENEGSEKSVIKKTSKISGTEATTTSRRGRPPGSLNKNSKKPKLSESAEKTKSNKTAVNSSKGKTTTARNTNKRSNKNEREQLANSAKPLPAPTTAKAPARTKNADRSSNRRRK